MRRLVINADDFGLSDGICRAIHELFEVGAISSTTLMIAAEGAIERCKILDIRKLVGKVGVHLQLTDGRPISPLGKIPSLIDKRSGMFKSKNDFAKIDLEDVEREWKAQIEMAYELLDAKPSHLDSHHGAHHFPRFIEIFLKLATQFNLPIRDRTAMQEYKPNLKLLGTDVVLYDWTAHGLNSENLQREIHQAIVNSTDAEILELVTHPGYSTDELRSKSSLTKLREIDLASLRELARSKWLELHGVQLISFSEIY